MPLSPHHLMLYKKTTIYYRGKYKENGAQLFFTSNIENYIIKGELIDEKS